MISKDQFSRFRNRIGLALCLALGACAAPGPAPEGVTASGGPPVTLRFVDIEARAALQLLADFAGRNIVISDQVRDVKITLSAQDVPWGDLLAHVVECVGAEVTRFSEEVILIGPSANSAGAGNCRDIEVSG